MGFRMPIATVIVVTIAILAEAGDPTIPILNRVAAYEFKRLGDLSKHTWSEATFYRGVMNLYEVTHDTGLLEKMYQMGESTCWTPRLYNRQRYCAANYAIGEVYARLYRIKRDPKMIGPLRAQLNELIARPHPRMLWTPAYDDDGEGWKCADALFMGPPALARLSEVTEDSRYIDYACRLWARVSNYLYDKKERLFYRDSRFFRKTTRHGKRVFWGRGNGWVMAGICMTASCMKRSDNRREILETQLSEMAARMKELQLESGLWASNLLDPEGDGETSASGLICFALASGARTGCLSPEQYLPTVERAWSAILSRLGPNGEIRGVQGVAAAPGPVMLRKQESYAVGAVLLAGSEIVRLRQDLLATRSYRSNSRSDSQQPTPRAENDTE